VQFQRVGEEAGFMEPDSDEDDEQEKKAEAVNTAAKDWGRVHLSPYTCYTHTWVPQNGWF